MERKIRYAWWGVLVLLIMVAIWKFFLPHGSNVAIERSGQAREIVVYISGAVEKPSLVHLPMDARLNDALKQVAPLPEANLDQMNPAEKLKDGQKITVPYKLVAQPTASNSGSVLGSAVPGGGVIPNTSSASNGTLPSNNSSTGSVGQQGMAGVGDSSSGMININTAGITELDRLPGIGPALAERIIQYRNDHGAFVKPEDLQKVSGIGATTYEKMASRVSVGP